MAESGAKKQHVRVRIPEELDQAIVALRARENLSFDEACKRIAIRSDPNSKLFEEAVDKKAQELGKSTFMKQLNSSRATIQKNEADTVRNNEDNFHVPCSKCGKPMSFSNRDSNWSTIKPVLYAAFKTWSHTTCQK